MTVLIYQFSPSSTALMIFENLKAKPNLYRLDVIALLRIFTPNKIEHLSMIIKDWCPR